MGFNHSQAPTAVDMASMFIKLVKNLKPWMDVTTVCVQNKACNVQLDRAQRMVLVRQLFSLNMNAYNTKYCLLTIHTCTDLKPKSMGLGSILPFHNPIFSVTKICPCNIQRFFKF